MPKLIQIKELPLDQIIVKDRARTELPNVEALCESISENGLLYPIIVTDTGRLVEGERRLTAFKKLERSTIPCRIIPDLGEDEALIIELIGNTDREAFKWHEEIDIKAKLHTYWKGREGSDWGYRETAEKMKVSLGGLSSDLSLADAIKAFPQLKDCDSKRKAQDAYKKLIEQVKNYKALKKLPDADKANLAKMLGSGIEGLEPKEESTSTPTKAKHADVQPDLTSLSGSSDVEQPDDADTPAPALPKHKYAIESWETFIPQIPDASVGFIELDPPYAIDFNATYGKTSKTKSKATDWTVDQLQDCFRSMLPILFDKLLDNSWILCWTGKEHWQWINEGARACGFHTQEPGIWPKTGGGSNTPSTNMVSNYEMFLLLRKGNATFNIPSLKSVLPKFDSAPGTQRSHQWEKPMPMYNFLFEALGKPNTIFLSPFAGSGNSLIASALNDMIPMGCDLEQKYLYSFYRNFNSYFFIQEED